MLPALTSSIYCLLYHIVHPADKVLERNVSVRDMVPSLPVCSASLEMEG